MQFQNSPPSSNQLLHLRNRLFKKHLIISLPSIIILILIFHLSPLLAPYPALQPPELKAPSILTKYYQQLFDYSVFYANLAQMLYVTQLPTSNYTLDDLRTKYKDIEVGMYCINAASTNTSVICNKFVGLSMMSWQYQNSHALSACISSITICDKSTLGCVSTVESANWEVGILRGAGQCGSQLVLNDNSYILSCTQNIRILIRLVEIQNIHVQVSKNIQLSYYKYYQISITAPISKSVFQYGSIDTSSSLQQQTYRAQQSTLILQIKVNMQRNVKHMQYIAIFSGSVSLILIILVFKHEKDRITSWLTFNFSRKHLINRLYRYTIRDIFTGQKPNPSNILQSGPSSNLFVTLSSLIDKSLISIELQQKKQTHKQSFKFLNTLKIVFDGYKQSIIPLMQSKNRYILTNRFNLQTSINDMFEVQSKIIKEHFVRGVELGIEKEMFCFGYMAILKNQQQFMNFLQSDSQPMPKKLQKLFLKINASIHNPTALSQKLLQQQQLELAKSEQEQHYLEQNKQQLQLRTRVYIIPKYLTLLKQLDSKNNYAESLKLDRQLRSLAQIIQNTRFMLTRHNKTIRGFSK